MKTKFIILGALLAICVIVEVNSAPAHSMEAEIGSRGKDLDAKIEEIDRMIVRNWDELIGPLSDEDKKAYRRQYPDEAAEYDAITKHYGWPKTF